MIDFVGFLSMCVCVCLSVPVSVCLVHVFPCGGLLVRMCFGVCCECVSVAVPSYPRSIAAPNLTYPSNKQRVMVEETERFHERQAEIQAQQGVADRALAQAMQIGSDNLPELFAATGMD